MCDAGQLRRMRHLQSSSPAILLVAVTTTREAPADSPRGWAVARSTMTRCHSASRTVAAASTSASRASASTRAARERESESVYLSHVHKLLESVGLGVCELAFMREMSKRFYPKNVHPASERVCATGRKSVMNIHS